MNRLALENGTRFWHYSVASAPIEYTGGTLKKIFSDKKNEILPVGITTTYYNRLLFPSAVDLTHVFIANRPTDMGSDTTTGLIYVSTDTTDGFDGSWISSGTTLLKGNDYDTGSPQVFNQSGIKGLRWTFGGNSFNDVVYIQMIAMFGTPSSASLHMIETATTNLVTGETFAFGTVQRGITDDTSYSFRIRNDGATQANGVTVSSYMFPQDTLGGDVIGLSFSSDGGTSWYNHLDLGNITVGSNSGVINLKLTTFNDMPVGRYRPRIVVDAASWS